MAIEKKSSAKGSSHSKKKEINWTQVGVVSFCVLIVVMCILSFSNIDKLFQGGQLLGSVEDGNTAIVEYTLFIGGKPMVTSSASVLKMADESNPPITTEHLNIVAGKQSEETKDVLLQSGAGNPFKMLPDEYNRIVSEVVGMNVGEMKEFSISNSDLKMTITPEQASNMGIDFATYDVGKIGLLNFVEQNITENTNPESTVSSDTTSTETTDSTVTSDATSTESPDSTETPVSQTTSVRPALVTEKTDDKMTLQYGYDYVRLRLINGTR